VIIELMVSRHIDDRRFRIATSRPFDTAQSNTDIVILAGDIGVGLGGEKSANSVCRSLST
jgi:hypothetical protein